MNYLRHPADNIIYTYSRAAINTCSDAIEDRIKPWHSY